MSKLVRALALALGICLVISIGRFGGECEQIREEVLRLHVLAHSDSDEDQALKLKVRDAVVAKTAGLFDDATTEQEAYAAAQAALDEIEKTAQQCVWDEGYTYPVTVGLTDMYFTTRTYDTVTLPAGVYQALRVSIGDAAGQNWWCVVFPPLCVSSASGAAKLDDVLTKPQQDIVQNSGRYEVRFKVVEWWESAASWVRRRFPR